MDLYLPNSMEFIIPFTKGWTKEFNKISWNGGAPKYDIRDWAPEHEKMGKGVTLTDEEVKKMAEILGNIL